MFDTRTNEYIKSQLESYLRQKNIDTSRNFRCLNPNHEDKNPSMSIDRTSRSGLHCKCFSCGAYYDIFDLIALDYGIIDKSEVFKKAYEIFNLDSGDVFDTSIHRFKGTKFERNTPGGYQNTLRRFHGLKRENLPKINSQDNFEDLENEKYEIFNLDSSNVLDTSIHRFKGTKFERNTPRGYQNTLRQFHCPKRENLPKINSQDNFEDLENRKIDSVGRLVWPKNLDSNLNLNLEIEKSHQDLLENENALEHYLKRGLSLNIIKKYKLGYAQEGANSLLKNYPENRFKNSKSRFYKFILPYMDLNHDFNYFLTEIFDRNQVDKYNSKYCKISNCAESPIFNERYLRQENTPEVIFICEGIYDALSVEEAGGYAIAFSGIAHRRFLNLCRVYNPKDTVFVVSLDNDEAGIKASEKISKELDSLGFFHILRSSLNKDFNEDLVTNRDKFFEHIKKIIQDALEYKKNIEDNQRLEYTQDTALNFLKDFTDKISNQNSVFCPTGIKNLDKILDGGLYPGLYCIGSVSSLGKTTFCLQIADNVASNGKDVLIFSLEMSKYELIAKSISRHTMIEVKNKNLNSCFAKTTRNVLSNYAEFSQKDKEIIQNSIENYSKYASRIYIYEGVGNIGVEQVKQQVQNHIEITKNLPLVLIDYLQILAPYNERATDKQNTDKSILELKRLSRDYEIPVLGISSFNRDNYTLPVNMASFKESGAIEYSTDVLLGLQYSGMDFITGESERERNKRVRDIVNNNILDCKSNLAQKIDIKILKNRNGRKGVLNLNFYPMFNYFEDV